MARIIPYKSVVCLCDIGAEFHAKHLDEDGIHPKAEGYQKIAENWHKVLLLGPEEEKGHS